MNIPITKTAIEAYHDTSVENYKLAQSAVDYTVAQLATRLMKYRDALDAIVNTLGPDHICCCDGVCDGLREEAAEALRIATEVLG